MAIHFMKLQPEPFAKNKSEKKIYELRLFDEKRQKINVGDFIEFTEQREGGDFCITCVRDILKFDSFDELYANIPLEQLGYSADELDSASPADMEVYYTKEQQKQYGVVAIKLYLLA